MAKSKIFRLIDFERISRNLNKSQKLCREHGTKLFLKKIGHSTKKRLTKSAAKRSILKRNSIFKDIDNEVLKKDIERHLTTGIFRAGDEIELDIRAIPSDLFEKATEETQNLLDDEFTIYGHLNIKYDKDRFSWRRDPLTGFEWPQIMSRAQIKTQKPHGTDIKTIWEIARFQFLSPLAQTYILTGEEQYPRIAIDKVDSWIKENDFLLGPHWTVAMESSIRLLNWCLFLPLLDIFKYTSPSFKQKLTTSILEHLIFIRENLETSPSGAGNHYFADLVGLLLARLLFPSLSWAIETSEFAEAEFGRETLRQFTKSGMNFEGSLPYHRLSSEMLLIGAALIKKANRQVPPGIVERLRRVSDFTNYYADICENCPTIGDNDSGIFVKFFVDQELNRHRYLSCLFDFILQNEVEPDNWESFLCSVHFRSPDPSHISDAKKSDEGSGIELQVKNFNGLVIAKHRNEALFFNTLHSSEGHTHNDKLSIYPVIGKKPIFIDRGSFSYTGFPEKRHKDRMTSSHNGPMINRWEQNRIWKNDLFYVNGEAKCNTFIDSSDDIISITGCHNGYWRYSPGLMVFRKTEWNTIKRTILISDWMECKKSQKKALFTWYFLLNPDWSVVLKDNTLILKNGEKAVYFDDMDSSGMTLTQGTYCPNYQKESPCQALKASKMVGTGKKIRFLLRY
jgi:hypothetical protein